MCGRYRLRGSKLWHVKSTQSCERLATTTLPWGYVADIAVRDRMFLGCKILILPKFSHNFAQIQTNFAQKMFTRGCGYIPSSYSTGHSLANSFDVTITCFGVLQRIERFTFRLQSFENINVEWKFGCVLGHKNLQCRCCMWNILVFVKQHGDDRAGQRCFCL